MSMYFREHGKIYQPEYGPSRTKQSFKDSADINKILERAQIQGSLAHVEKYPQAVYGEFSQEADLLTSMQRIEKAKQIFSELPAEVRKDFKNDALAFVTWAGQQTPEELVKNLPAIAKPGKYFPDVSPRTPPGATLGETQGAASAVNSPTNGGTTVQSVQPVEGDTDANTAP